MVGHRGASETHPENTLPAFRKALRDGAQVLEFDVHATSDGELVVIHDETLDRTTDARRRFRRSGLRVDGMRAREIARLDAGAWKAARFRGARVPTLRQVLRLLEGRAIPMIEHKGGLPADYVALLRELGQIDAVLLQSFDWGFVAEAHALEPSLALGALGEDLLDRRRLLQLPATGACLVHWDVHDLRREDVSAWHRHDYLVCAYTANSDVELLGCAQLGIDAITTNRPGRLAELVRAGSVCRG